MNVYQVLCIFAASLLLLVLLQSYEESYNQYGLRNDNFTIVRSIIMFLNLIMGFVSGAFLIVSALSDPSPNVFIVAIIASALPLACAMLSMQEATNIAILVSGRYSEYRKRQLAMTGSFERVPPPPTKYDD